MTEAQVIAAVRRGIREPNPITVSDQDIVDSILQGVYQLGLQIKEVEPSFFNNQRAFSSDTYVFPWPTGCQSILAVWDLGKTAGDITDATNASPIVITQAAHGYSDDALLSVQDVVGNTAANGTWKITVIDDDSYSLDGSVGAVAYTSGGKSFTPVSDAELITEGALENSTLGNDRMWYPRGQTIVVDDMNFTNDLLVSYDASPTVISDIPEQYQQGIVSFCITHLLHVPKPEARDYADKTGVYQRHAALVDWVGNTIQTSFKSSKAPSHVRDAMRIR